MQGYDFNGAEPQREGGGLIPNGTVALVVMRVRPGQAGQGGWLKATNDGSGAMVDAEFVVDGGEYDRRRFWSLFMVEGQTDGQRQAVEISRSKIRAILESARGVMPGDDSQAAQASRRIRDFGDLDGLTFCAEIGVEKGKADGKGGTFHDKNILRAAVTPDRKDYIRPGGSGSGFGGAQAPVPSPSPALAPAGASVKPDWAQ